MHPAHAPLQEFSGWSAVDTSCHLGQWPYRLAASAGPAELREHARRHGLSEVWVSHLAALFGFDTRSGNEACLAAAPGDEVLRPFAVLDASEPTWPAELAWAERAGFAGIRIAPGFHSHRLADALELAAGCASAGLVLQVLVRLDDARSRHPLSCARDLEPREVADFVRAAPVVPLLISGLNWAEAGEVARHLGDQVPETVRFDLWHVNGPLGVADLLAEHPSRWVFGSGFPVQLPEPTMLQLTASRLAPDVLAAITRRNAEQLLRDS